uniref:Growth arrest-specific 7a n=1 Tax=Oreochromis niloticus TaxID=8128 RepID=A0A669D5B7_ORENI
MRAYSVMITQESIGGRTVGPYGRLRFGHMLEFVKKEASQKIITNNQSSNWELWERRAHGSRQTWTVVVAVRAASRHVLHGQDKLRDFSSAWRRSGAAAPQARRMELLRLLLGRQERPPVHHVGDGLRGSPAEAAEGQTAAEGDGRVYPRELHTEVEKPLLTFRGDNFKKDLKKYDHHIADLRKQLASRYASVEKARKALADRQKDLEVKTQQLEIKLSNKTEEDIKKARRKSTQAGDDLMRCVDLYNQTQSKWFEEMVTTSMELEKLEVERIEWIQQHLRQYTTLRHETDMFNQSMVEPVDQLLQNVDPAKDRELWVKENKTGDVRPVDMDI